MNLTEFIQKYSGEYINFDAVYGPQCMDLYRMYVKEVLCLPQSAPVAVAADVWRRYPAAHYTRIINTPTNYPTPGDIVIWSRWYGPAGHIAIAVTADSKGLICFSQNDPTGERAGLRRYGYRSVYGWLHPKGE